jgi:hypothetical protein
VSFVLSPNERDAITGGVEDFDLNAFSRNVVLRRRRGDPTATTKLNSIALDLRPVIEELDETITKFSHPDKEDHPIIRDLRTQLERVKAAKEAVLKLAEVS